MNRRVLEKKKRDRLLPQGSRLLTNTSNFTFFFGQQSLIAHHSRSLAAACY